MFKKDEKPTALEIARAEFEEATRRLHRAEAMFDLADADSFEVANSELTTARLQVENCLRKVKLMSAV